MSDTSGVTIVKPGASVTPPASIGPSRVLQHVPMVLMIIVSIITIAYMAALAFVKMPDGAAQPFNQAGTLIVGAFISIVGYYFGSSKSSQAKDETISKLSQ